MRKLALLFVLTVAACGATEERYKQNMANLVGTSEDSLRKQWGIPDQTYTRDGTTYLTYNRVRQSHGAAGGSTSTGPTYFSSTGGSGGAYSSSPGGSGSGSANGGAAAGKPCKTVFTITDATVRNWRAEGTGCRA
jgi:hypothetical protein